MTLDGFESIPATTAGGTFNGSPFRVVLHTTEGGSIEGAVAAFQSTGSWPHFTVDPNTKRKAQHYELDTSARALLHPQGYPETNRANAIQIEIVGYAANSPLWSPDWLAWLAVEVLTPIRKVCPFKLVAPMFVTYPSSYGTGASQRMTWDEWAAFNGVCGHEHVPGNDHGDPGGIDITTVIAAVDPQPSQPSSPQEDDMTPGQCLDKTGAKWFFAVSSDHQLWAWNAGEQKWFPLGGDLHSGVDALVNADGSITICGVGTDLTLWQCIIYPKGSPTPGKAPYWESLGGQFA